MTMNELGEISKTTPYLAKIKPSGVHTMLDFDEAGGVGAVLKALSGMADLDLMTVNGKTPDRMQTD